RVLVRSFVRAAALTATDLTLGYDRTPVVHDVSVSIAPGAVTALLGPNGSGKSTVLRSLARLHPIASGDVVVSTDGAQTASSALSAMEFARFVTLTCADRTSITHAFELSGTDRMADRLVDQLSGGELHRVWLATCLAQDTGVLLLDEPKNHLDLRYQAEILDLTRELADDHGIAVGVVLHDLGHAAAVAEHVVLLDRGRIRSVGTCEDVFT